MEASVLLAKEYMKRARLTDVGMAKIAIKAMVTFAEAGAEIGIAGVVNKPDPEVCRAILSGLNKLQALAKGQSGPQKLFQPSESVSLAHWEALPGKVQYQCGRCRHVLQPGERFKQATERRGEGCSITTKLCPRCRCPSFYVFKYAKA